MYFALAATAGLFASCSSDNLSENQTARLATIDENAPAKIELSVGSLGATVETRGTGSVGIAADGSAGFGWAGQKFNAFMLEKGTMKYAHMTFNDPTTPFVFQDDPTDATVKNGKGAEFTTPNQNGVSGYSATGLTTGLEVYYPTEGVYDFWAYRLDDAYKGGAITGYDDATEDAIKIPFEIDGTQDIMVAAVTPDYGTLTPEQQTACAAKLYSAYTGRRSVKAKLDFKHQLTRLTFKVKANSKEVSAAADPVPGAPTYNGFKVTGISVRSNTTGKLVAASTDANWNPEAAIEWDNADWGTPLGLPELQLKSRAYGVAQQEKGAWFAIDLNAAVVGTTTLNTTYHGVVTITNDMVAYETQDRNANSGVPTSTRKTIAEWVAADPTATVYYWDVQNSYQADMADININEDLQTLIPVQPKWNVAIHTETILFTIPTGVVNVADDADITTQLTATAAAAGDYTVLQADDASYYSVTWDGTAVTAKSDALYTVTGAETVVADIAALNTAQDAAATTGSTVFFVGGSKYINSSVTTAKPATEAAVATPVGEALMVAPAAADGYLVTVYYSYWNKDNATTSHEVTTGKVSKQIVLKNKSGMQTAQPYKAGKQYNITIELFKNGTAESTTTVTDWDDDDDNELDDSYEFE